MSKIKLLAGIGLLVLIAAGVLYGMGYWPVHKGAAMPAVLVAEKAPAPAPMVAFGDAAGARHGLGDYKGHYVLLNLWATWCGPCVAELPSLAKLKAAVPGLTVLAVDVGRDTAPAAEAFLKGHHAEALGTFVDTDIALIRAFGAYGLPMTVLIDPGGKVIAKSNGGADWASPDMVAYFKSITANS